MAIYGDRNPKKEEKMEQKKIFEIMVENFPHLVRAICRYKKISETE